MPPDKESAFASDPHSDVLAQLTAREPIFHRPELGTTRADFEEMAAEDFWEVGASGRIYTRKQVLDALENRHAHPHPDLWKTMDFACRELSPDVYLLTYTLIQNHTRHTRRSTIWKRTGEGWKIIYHQGTVIENA